MTWKYGCIGTNVVLTPLKYKIMGNVSESTKGNNANILLAFRCSDEENRYRVELISELIDMYEHPENSNEEWKKAIIEVAREKGYGNER